MGAQILTILLGIIIPRLVLVNLGSESNGLLNSVNNILAYMSLLEAGVGTATLQALYKPLAEDNKERINRIMSATDRFYRRTGSIYFVAVILLAIFYSYGVESELPKHSVFLVVLLAGLSGVLNYFFQGKYKILFSAEGKGYISSNITTITHAGTSIAKAMILLAGGNVVAVQTTYFLFNLAQMLLFVIYIRKNYKWLDFTQTPDYDSISQRNAVLVHQISTLIFLNTDIIILTLFTSLKVVSVYSMYAMIFGLVKTVSVTLSDSYVYALGQTYTDKPRFMRLFNLYEVLNLAITFALFCVAYVLILPFLKLYTQGITDINYIDPIIALLFVAYYLMDNGRKPSLFVINIAQHFQKTKWRSILESVINLSVSLALTYRYGIYGVLWGTIAALLYRTNDMIIYAARLMNRSPMITYKRWGMNLLFFAIFCVIFRTINYRPDTYVSICLYGILLSIVIIPSFVMAAVLQEPEVKSYLINMIRRKLVNRLRQ